MLRDGTAASERSPRQLSDNRAENRFNGEPAVLIKAAVFADKQRIDQRWGQLFKLDNFTFFIGRKFGNQIAAYIKNPCR